MIRWVRYANDIRISLNTSMKAYKKRTTNYIILPKTLNEELQDFDIVTKIERIKEHYRSSNIPKHIATVISFIEALPEYQALFSLAETDDASLLKHQYEIFVEAFFTDINDSGLRSHLTTSYKNVFVMG